MWRIAFVLVFWCSLSVKAQHPDSLKKALALVEKAELSFRNDSIWPNVNPQWFFRNIKENLKNPLYLNQGKPTNFCGYAAITHFMILDNPINYAQLLLDLYQKGEAQLITQKLIPSQEVKAAAGLIYNKGQMDISHADQLWFLALADGFKGYLNWFNKKYNPGDENTFWASSNLRKFNRILREVCVREIHCKGSDLIRPAIGNRYDFIKDKSNNHTLLLYLNNKKLYPSKFFRFVPPSPTHFVVLYNMDEIEGYYVLDYWDYSLRTKTKVKKEKFQKLIYGITYIKNP